MRRIACAQVLWDAEKDGYAWESGGFGSDPNACSIEMCGHYTQVVWGQSGKVPPRAHGLLVASGNGAVGLCR